MSPELSFFDRLSRIQDALDSHDGAPSALPLIETYLCDPEVRREFLTRILNRADWVTALHKAGYFNDPPEPMQTREGGVKHPPWPESQYLAKMAKLMPEEVASIFANLETDNITVIGDMIDASLAMPAEFAARLVPKISRAAKSGSLWSYYFKEASKLCIRLAEGGEVSSAISLAEALFTPQFEQGQEKPSRIDEYWYKDGIKKVIPALVKREPRKFLVKLCQWLKSFVDAKNGSDPESGKDLSYLWRPAIEEHGQNPDYDFAGAMVGFVRQGFEQAIREGGLSLTKALEIVNGYSYIIFKRIGIHLINEFSDQDVELARQTMMTEDLFNVFRFKHEYAMLVGSRFNLLTQEESDKWFGWVDRGPDMDSYSKSFQEREGRDPSDDEKQKRKDYWQFEKLHWIRKHLEGKRLEFYKKMREEHPEPEMADLNVYMGPTRWGSESPMNVVELGKLTFEQAVERVSAWKADEARKFMGPDVEGLAETFGKYVAANPVAFSEKAEVLIGRPPIYVRTFIDKMAEAVKTGKGINVSAVLKLCQWVLNRPPDELAISVKDEDEFVDKNWLGSRDAICELIQQICQAKVDEKTDTPRYPMEELRDPISQAINKLYQAPAESYIVHDISKDDPRVNDYLMMGMNSARGRALEAALDYARWIANHIKKPEGNHDVIAGGFSAMPEVRDILEWNIAPDNRSYEALAVIGSRISLIYWIDKDWLANNSERLFSLKDVEESPQNAPGWAAWNAFLVWQNPHIEYYRLFKEQYAYAVAQSAKVTPVEKTRENPMNRLGEHLMILYGRGQLGLDDDAGLLRRFLSDSHPDIRRHAVGSVGFSLESDQKIPEQIINRFMPLWETYWQGAGKKDAEEKPDSFMFGTWFAYGQFPEGWALEQLEKFVEVTGKAEPHGEVMEQLAKVSPSGVARAVRILDQMVRGDKEGWRTYEWKDSARQILKMAMGTGGEARTQAEQVINFLGRRGFAEFGKLLNL